MDGGIAPACRPAAGLAESPQKRSVSGVEAFGARSRRPDGAKAPVSWTLLPPASREEKLQLLADLVRVPGEDLVRDVCEAPAGCGVHGRGAGPDAGVFAGFLLERGDVLVDGGRCFPGRAQGPGRRPC
jgi:hypothetical protein